MTDITLYSRPAGAQPPAPGWASRIWETLTVPHPKIVASDQRRRAYIASAVLFALIFCTGVFMLVVPSASSIIPWVIVIVAYGLSRTEYFEQAVLLACGAYILAVVWSMMGVPDWTVTSPLVYLAWLIVPMLLCGLLLPPRLTFVMAVVLTVLMLGIRPVLLPTIPPASFGVAGGFVIMMAVLITLATYLQQFYFVRPQLREIQDAQRELEQKNAALEKANRDIRDFSYIIAHDLRAPAISMSEYVRELRYSLEQITPALEMSKLATQERTAAHEALTLDLPESLGFIESSAHRMQSHISEILRIARAGQRDMEYGVVQLKGMVERQIAQRGVTHPDIRFEARSIPDTIHADAFVIEEALSNLLDNSTKYRRPGIETVITITGEQRPNEWVVHVQDNGRGIDAAEQKMVMQPFRRAGNVQDVAGSGVGLYYVHSMLQRHGGRVWFDSKVGEGSTFSFSIPHQMI